MGLGGCPTSAVITQVILRLVPGSPQSRGVLMGEMCHLLLIVSRCLESLHFAVPLTPGMAVLWNRLGGPSMQVLRRSLQTLPV